MASESAIQIKGFKGLNIREHKGVIQDNELSEAINFDIGRAGELIKRTGLTQLHDGSTLGPNSVTILGHFITSSLSQIIVKAGDNVYYTTDGTTYTLLGAYADATFGVQYIGKFYIIRSGNLIVEWDGAAASDITGSPSGTFAIIYKDRMYVLNSEGAGLLNSRFYFSDAGDVTSTGWAGDQFIDVQSGDGDFLVSMAVIQDLLVIFKGDSTWGLYVQGLTSDWVLRSLNDQVGCVSKNAMQIVDGFLYISSVHGIYRTDGATFESISDSIHSVIENRVVNTTTVNLDSIAYWDDKLICLIATDSSSKVYYVYHLKVGGWTEWQFAGDYLPGTFLEIQATSPSSGLYAGSHNSDGRMFKFGDQVYQDVGESYTASLKTKEFDLDVPTNMKRGKWLALDVVNEATIDWCHEVDGVELLSDSLDSAENRSALKIPGPGFFRVWRFCLSSDSDVTLTVISITMHLSARRTLIKAIS